MHIVPPLALFLAKEPVVEKFDLSSLKTLVSGAAPLGQEITRDVEQKLGVDFMQGELVTISEWWTIHWDCDPRIKELLGFVTILGLRFKSVIHHRID